MRNICRSLAALSCLAAGPALAAQAAAPATPAANPCATAEFHQFDFWAGQWDVYGPKGKQVANSLIEKVYGCGIRENWMPFNAADGGSLNIYVPDKKQWEQFWIDSGGTRATFVGGLKGREMVIEGVWGGPLVRITYTPNADGSVRQYGVQSTDGGKTWAPSFDFLYKPHAPGTAFPTPQG
ncbi:MAG TPA: hypothetical protein VM145_02075 [Sphingomicrobium sp.]|nr:hypothetical protein [Sphingomicrobium sp.]